MLTGINYVGTENQLNGCVDDINNVNQLLQQNGFNPSNITMFSDDDAAANAQPPTRDNVLNQFTRLVTNAKAGDRIFFHYSGHGTQTLDPENNQYDDDAMCTLDGDQITLITAQDLKQVVDQVPNGVKVVCLMDCCHSGTLFDLTNNADNETPVDADNDLNHGYTVMLSGCMDSETSADAVVNGTYEGALTAAFLNFAQQQGFSNLLDTLCSNDMSQIQALRQQFDDWMSQQNYSQTPNISFEGNLTAKSLKKAPAQAAQNIPYIAATLGLVAGMGIALLSGVAFSLSVLVGTTAALLGYGLAKTAELAVGNKVIPATEKTVYLATLKDKKAGFEAALDAVKKNKADKSVVDKFTVLIKQAKTANFDEAGSAMRKQPTKDLLQIYKFGEKHLKHLNETEGRNHQKVRQEILKKVEQKNFKRKIS